MAKRTPEQIIALVDTAEKGRSALNQRFESDYAIYRLEEHLPPDPEGKENENVGYRIYTSNEPQTFTDKIVSWAVSATLLIRCPEHEEQKHERDIDNQKENFLFGCLKAADERLLKRTLPTLRDQLAFFSPVRGYLIGRALLVKRARGVGKGEPAQSDTYVDITPWDVLHSYWSVGSDGLDWACYKIKKTRSAIEAEYGIKIPQTNGTHEDDDEYVYDFFDMEHNTVVMEGRALKKSTPHGSPRTPVFLAVTGSAPPIQSSNSDAETDYGESVFKSNRAIYAAYNQIMSIIMELTARARKPPIVIASPTGEKTVDEDPYKTGTVMSLAAGEKVEAMQLLEMTRDTGAFIGLVAGEIQRGSLPHTAYGEIAFQLSGFAITQLRQGIDTVIQPQLRTIENAYKQITQLLSDQYITGRFEPMELSGWNNDREHFDMQITPDIVRMGCDPHLELVGDLPEDQASKIAAAAQLREGPHPLLHDRYILDNVLKIANTNKVAAGIKEQQAERMSPLAVAYTLGEASAEQGRPELMNIYLDELRIQYLTKQLELLQLQMAAAGLTQSPPGGGPSPNGGGGGGRGGVPSPPRFAPEVAPNAVMGAPPPPPNMQAGPNVPPGSQRPGAWSSLRRLIGR